MVVVEHGKWWWYSTANGGGTAQQMVVSGLFYLYAIGGAGAV
jgi:hypothetical protein